MNRYQKLNIDALDKVFNMVIGEFGKNYKTMKRNKDLILEKIAQILLDYDIVDDMMSLSSSQKDLLVQELFDFISELLQEEYENEKSSIKDNLKKTAEETNNLKYYVLGLGKRDTKLKKLKKNKIDEIIDRKVDRKNWSDRLWNNKYEMERKLKKDIKGFLDGKISVNKIKSIINKRYSENAYNSERLVETEIARVQCEVNEDFFEEEEIELVMYLATLDKKTCNDCGKYDGNIYHLYESRPKLPQHPNCRCCYCEVLPDWRPSTRKDNTQINDVIDFTDYQNWLKNSTS